MRFRWLQPTRHVSRIKKFCWRSNPKSPGLLFWVFYTLEEQSFQQMVPWTRIEFQLPHLKKTSSSNKDLHLLESSETSSWTRIPRLNFTLWSAVSNPKEPKTSTNFCILCAVREELTYICRVCLTKVYPLFSDREEFILCSCRQGSLSSVFKQGRVYPLKFFNLEMKVYPLFFQAGKILGITC